MGPGTSGTDNSTLADMVNEMAKEAKRGATALMDEEVGTLGVPNPRILIVGCGGSGNNTLNRITHLGVEGAVTVAINTDKQHLDHTRALQKLLVGRHITRGLGAGGDPSTGRRCAEAGREMIRRIVTGADLVFIASGLGGGSGTGICPIVAEEAKAAGCHIIIITSGGKLKELAEANNLHTYPLNGGYQPRMTIGFGLSYLLMIIGELLGQDIKSEIKEIREGFEDNRERQMESGKRIFEFFKN